jgi:hypothetical protein
VTLAVGATGCSHGGKQATDGGPPPPTSCRSSLDCSLSQVCDTTAGLCVDCLADVDCADTTKTCVATMCRTKCASDRTCTPLGLLCDLATSSCVRCVTSTDCASGLSCQAGACVSGATGAGGAGGGSPGSGGAIGSGGATGSGGASGDGGATGSGGAVGAGGGTGTGGAAGTGGATGSGGTAGTGGTTGTGGGTGGATGSGGATGTGGTTGTGGSAEITCSTMFVATTGGWVTVPTAPGGTCWHGYAYNFGDSIGTTATPGLTNTYASCGTVCALGATGTVAPSTAANNYGGYVGIGFQLNQPLTGGTATATVTPKGSGLTVSFSGNTGALAVRAQLTDGTTTWCRTVTTSPVTIPYSSFNTKCYDAPPDGTAYAKQPVNAFQLVVVGGVTATDYSISLTSVVENP